MALKTQQSNLIYSMIDRVTPIFISSLSKNEIFVFGSNSLGVASGGSSLHALDFGYTKGLQHASGPSGRTYAIITYSAFFIDKSRIFFSYRDLALIKPFVDDFIRYAAQNPHLKFLVTSIAPRNDQIEVSRLFSGAINLDNVSLPAHYWVNL